MEPLNIQRITEPHSASYKAGQEYKSRSAVKSTNSYTENYHATFKYYLLLKNHKSSSLRGKNKQISLFFKGMSMTKMI